jgi:hypothetical protein
MFKFPGISSIFPGIKNTIPGTRQVEFPGIRSQITRN